MAINYANEDCKLEATRIVDSVMDEGYLQGLNEGLDTANLVFNILAHYEKIGIDQDEAIEQAKELINICDKKYKKKLKEHYNCES